MEGALGANHRHHQQELYSVHAEEYHVHERVKNDSRNNTRWLDNVVCTAVRMTNGRVHLGLIMAGVPLYPGPPAFPFSNWGVQGGDLGGEAPAIDGVGGLKVCPVWAASGVEVA